MNTSIQVFLNDLANDFANWVDNEMENWEPEERYECVEDGGPIVDDDRELARFLAEYPKYNFDMLYNNLDDLNEIVQSVATKYKEDDMD